MLLQFSVRRGTARTWDHAQLIHELWLHAAILNMSIHIVRVASSDNVADLPSRHEFKLLKDKGAIEVGPHFGSEYCSEKSWAVLHDRWKR